MMTNNSTPQKVRFRKAQREILKYKRGLMGIAAVPGSGKTFTLSHLAARLVEIVGGELGSTDREVLIVTFSNSAVNTFKNRIAGILQRERGLLPYTGYRVRTLHGLAHDIVRERPALVGLSEDFQIVDDRLAFTIRRETVLAHFPEWEAHLSGFLDNSLNERQQRRVLKRDYPEALVYLVSSFISRAKEYEITPEMLEERLDAAADPAFDLARFATRVYADYQRSLRYRGAVDFDDLIRLALMALQMDPQYLERLRERWVYVLEDEAQDSSYLQEQMLTLLTGDNNWVRVGDPNQAINTTFTTSNPVYLRDFLERYHVKNRPLHVSGRSAQPIIDMANRLVEWAVHEHSVPELHQAFYEQKIIPAPAKDAQTNPPANEAEIFLLPPDKKWRPDDELQFIVRSLQKWLPDHPDQTVAVLLPENNRGFKLAEMLREARLPYEELLRSTTRTREAASHLSIVLEYLADPRRGNNLATLFNAVWIPLIFPDDPEDDGEIYVIQSIREALRSQKQMERLIYPEDDRLPLTELLNLEDLSEGWQALLTDFFAHIRRWLDALSLPIDQLVLTIGYDLFKEPSDVALGYKIAVLLKSAAKSNPAWRLPDFVNELRAISENQRKFLGFDDTESGYEPRPGVVTISTFHSAKGLEWDRVYLGGVNNYSFPSARSYDGYASEKWFIRDNLNLDAEILEQLACVIEDRMQDYRSGAASQQARLDYAAERLRLLYVGITRARRDLCITWNMGRFWESGGPSIKQPSEPLIFLQEVRRDKS